MTEMQNPTYDLILDLCYPHEAYQENMLGEDWKHIVEKTSR